MIVVVKIVCSSRATRHSIRKPKRQPRVTTHAPDHSQEGYCTDRPVSVLQTLLIDAKTSAGPSDSSCTCHMAQRVVVGEYSVRTHARRPEGADPGFSIVGIIGRREPLPATTW